MSIFLVKQRWHTGIVIPTENLDTAYFKVFETVKSFKYFDIGWGDEAFYRHPDFDIELAIKALFYPTETALRIEGFNFNIDKYLMMNDMAYEIRLSRISFNILSRFISETFKLNSGNKPWLIESRYSGNISFYNANGKYTLLNTCNTWAATGLKLAGLDISNKLVLVEQLFNEIEDLPQVKQFK